MTNHSNWNEVYISVNNTTIIADFAVKKIKDLNPTPPPSNETNPTPVRPTPTPENPTPADFNLVYVTEPTIIDYYYIDYDLDGGKFIDGTTSRREIVKSSKPIGALETNPIKSGYKFDKWVLSNSKEVDFDKSPSEYKSLMNDNVLKLKAVWVKDEDSDKFTCPDGYDIYEPTSGYCYKVLEVDDKTPNSEPKDTSKTYNWTRYTYPVGAKYCYNYFTGKCASGVTNDSTCSPYNNIFVEKGSNYTTYEDAINNAYSGTGVYNLVSGFSTTSSGKDNAKYEGYPSQDWWERENTCKFGSTCKDASEVRSTDVCYKEYGAIIFDRKSASLVPEDEEENVVPISDDEIDDISENNKDKTDEEVTVNSKTGDTLFIIALIVGIGALGYSAYYFINNYKTRKANI